MPLSAPPTSVSERHTHMARTPGLTLMKYDGHWLSDRLLHIHGGPPKHVLTQFSALSVDKPARQQSTSVA